MKQAKIIMTAKLLTEREVLIPPETPVHLGEVLTAVRGLRGKTSESRPIVGSAIIGPRRLRDVFSKN